MCKKKLNDYVCPCLSNVQSCNFSFTGLHVHVCMYSNGAQTLMVFFWYTCIYFIELPADNLVVPDNSRHGSDGVQLFDRVQGGITNGFDSPRQTVLGDSEVQQILGSNGTATVQVLVEMNGQEESSTEAGWIPESKH